MLQLWRSQKSLVLAAVVASCILLLAVINGASGRASTQTSPNYIVGHVTRSDVTQSIVAAGQLRPLVSVDVSSQISGLVTEVHVDFNTIVKEGDVLARIEASTYEQRLSQAQANLNAANAAYNVARLNESRMHDLRRSDLITQQDYETIGAQLEQAHASLLTHQAEVKNARVDLDRCTIRSPINGIVIFRQIEVGKTVVSSLSAPTLFTIAQNLSRMRIVASVNELDVPSIRVGQSVEFSVDAFRNRIFSGEVVQIRNPYAPSDSPPRQEPQRNDIVLFDTIIDVDNRDLILRPGITANVSILVQHRTMALVIPNAALRLKLGGDAVRAGALAGDNAEALATIYRAPGNATVPIPEAVQVRLGIGNDTVTEVLSGLSEGDSVIVGISPPAQASALRPLLF